MARGSVLLAGLLAGGALAQGPGDAQLFLVTDATAAKFGAACLDGSKPGYFVRRGSATGKWKIHIQGGGWCTSLQDCYYRSQLILGSSSTWSNWLSSYWPPENAGFYGIVGNSSPYTGDWNFAWFGYCDGTSFTSDRDTPLSYNGTQLYFRGRANLDAYLAELETLFGFLSQTSELVVSGTSAGGLATYLHASYIKSRVVNPNARVVAAPDAGFFLDVGHYGTPDVHVWYDTLQAAIGPALWNATLRGNAGDCWAALSPVGNGTQCFFPEYLARFQKDVQFFFIQSTYDTANIAISYGLSCHLGTTCNATEAAAYEAYAVVLKQRVLAAASVQQNTGYWLTSCVQHETSCRAYDWFNVTIGGQSADTTFWRWYTQGAGNSGSTRQDVPWPGDATCAPPSFTHGAC